MDRAEAAGLGVSLAAHGAVLAALIYGLARATGLPPSPPAIEVSFAEEFGPVTSDPAPGAEAAAAAAGTTESLPAQPAPADPVPAQPRLREAQPAAEPQRPAERRTEPAQPARRRGLEDLDPDSFGADRNARGKSPAAMTGEARASIDAAIVRALRPCQRQPLPAPEAAAIRVRMRVTLNRDGSLARAEMVRVENDNPALAIYERRMQDLARNVITQCTPIRGLPPEYYDVPRGWRQFPFTFDPRAR